MTHLMTRYKHVDAIVDLAVDFANRLASGETLSSGETLTVYTASHGAVTDLTIASVAISGTTVQARVSGGSAGKQIDDERWETEYCLKCSVVTSSGETEREVVKLVTYDCVGTGT